MSNPEKNTIGQNEIQKSTEGKKQTIDTLRTRIRELSAGDTEEIKAEIQTTMDELKFALDNIISEASSGDDTDQKYAHLMDNMQRCNEALDKIGLKIEAKT